MITPCPAQFLPASQRALTQGIVSAAAEVRRLMVAAISNHDERRSVALGRIANDLETIAMPGAVMHPVFDDSRGAP